MISIVIPTFGDFKRVDKLLTSIRRYEKSNFETIVVNDKPLTQFLFPPEFKVTNIQNDTNLGFAKSVNKGLALAKGDILLLLNDDIVFNSPCFDKVEAEFRADSQLGILGALLKYPGSMGIQHGGVTFNSKHPMFLHVRRNPQTKYMIAVTGAFFAISRKLYEKIGGLDEKYFLACEDTQYCLDAWRNDFKVKFAKHIVAIHEEGATRGRTPQQKAKHMEWTKKEHDGIRRFQATWDFKEIESIQKKIRVLNKENIKIELGSGHSPHPGYKHLDIRAGLPQLDYVCDFTREALPFEDNSVEEILANHVIEHIPFRKLPFVIKEWSRVLEDGGKLLLRTPNLRFICEKYLAGEITPEHPGDEKFIKENLSKEVTPSWWANLKLFSGQDYDANFHHVCFDFKMLADLLCKYGFSTVEQAKFDREFSPGELQLEAYKGGLFKTISYIGKDGFKKPTVEDFENLFNEIKNGPKKEKSCLVVRSHGMGDVLLTTPIIERLSQEYKIISVCTKRPDIFKYNPHVKTIYAQGSEGINKTRYDRIIDLDLAYEKNPKMHIIDAYSLEAFGDTKTPHEIKLYEPFFPKQNYIVIHAAKSWENRTWSIDSWTKVLQELQKRGEALAIVGANDDYKLSLESGANIINFVGHQTFWELVKTIQQAKLFIGMDSGPLHIAQAVGTPAIGMFTCAKVNYRVTNFNNLYPIAAPIDCYGCLHDEKPPVTYCGCRRGDFKCLDLLTPEKVMEAYERFRDKTSRRDIEQQNPNPA